MQQTNKKIKTFDFLLVIRRKKEGGAETGTSLSYSLNGIEVTFSTPNGGLLSDQHFMEDAFQLSDIVRIKGTLLFNETLLIDGSDLVRGDCPFLPLENNINTPRIIPG